jgi:hypothetical protein
MKISVLKAKQEEFGVYFEAVCRTRLGAWTHRDLYIAAIWSLFIV